MEANLGGFRLSDEGPEQLQFLQDLTVTLRGYGIPLKTDIVVDRGTGTLVLEVPDSETALDNLIAGLASFTTDLARQKHREVTLPFNVPSLNFSCDIAGAA
ncbi:MAG: hypothetical protein Q8Q10_02645 [bacterium]|nr:hypothetical protein [bacterium]